MINIVDNVNYIAKLRNNIKYMNRSKIKKHLKDVLKAADMERNFGFVVRDEITYETLKDIIHILINNELGLKDHISTCILDRRNNKDYPGYIAFISKDKTDDCLINIYIFGYDEMIINNGERWLRERDSIMTINNINEI